MPKCVKGKSDIYNLITLKIVDQKEMDKMLKEEKKDVSNKEKWIALIKQYTEPKELTASMLNSLIEKIVVHEAVKTEDGMREQEVEIFYRFIGKID